MEYRQTPLTLLVRAITLWWWVGMFTLGISIIWDVLSYKRTKLVLKEKSLTYMYGVLTQNSRELSYRNIQTVDVNQSVMGQIFGYGHITIMTANMTEPIVLKYANKPQLLRTMLQGQIPA